MLVRCHSLSHELNINGQIISKCEAERITFRNNNICYSLETQESTAQLRDTDK